MFFLLIGLLASAIGALSGIGGGIILKPLLDAFTELNSNTIGFLSSVSVFTMAVTSAIKHRKNKSIFAPESTWLGWGAVLGGLLGMKLFQFTILYVQNDNFIKLIQNISLCILLIIIVIYLMSASLIKFKIKNRLGILIAGTFLGLISSYLGIGGGPINVAVLLFLFSMDLKSATVNSMILILFSQASKLTTLFLSGSMPSLSEVNLLIYLIPAAIAGGWIGTIYNKKLNAKQIKTAYYCVMFFVILTCLFNIVQTIVYA